MKLDVHNGNLVIGELKFRPDSKVADYSAMELRQYTPDNGYSNFFVKAPEEDIADISCYFKQDVLERVSIGLVDDNPLPKPFEVSDHQRQLAYKRVEELGGEHAYIWGSVSVSEDRKGGQISIVVSYDKDGEHFSKDQLITGR